MVTTITIIWICQFIFFFLPSLWIILSSITFCEGLKLWKVSTVHWYHQPVQLRTTFHPPATQTIHFRQFKTTIIRKLTFLLAGLPVGNLQKINQNQKTSWDCNSCSTHSIYKKWKVNVNLNLTFIFINKNIVNKWWRMLFISFPFFPTFSLWQMTTNF